jgi:urease accessory protein
MAIPPSGPATSWRAELDLSFERRGERSVLARRRHEGPLVVQKSLHPEGDAVCHAIIVHPPAGIAGGDELVIDSRVAGGAHALLTTPGATRWYRTAGPWASQRVRIAVASGACLEWLPQENIVFAGALARSSIAVDLEPGAVFIGWDMVCLGRRGSGETFDRGAWRVDNQLRAGARLHWVEAGRIDGGSAGLSASAVLDGASVSATFMAFAPHVHESRWRALRQACLGGIEAAMVDAGKPGDGAHADELSVSLLPGLLIGRYLGDSVEMARRHLVGFWREARPVLTGLAANEPRIWRT